MNTEEVGRASQVAIHLDQDLGNEPFLELAVRVFEADSFGHHFLDETLQLFTHTPYSSSRPVRRRYASMYFSRVRLITSSGREGTGGCLFQRIPSR